MYVSYKPLWKLLIDRGIKKKDLCAMAGISPASCTKMGKGGHMTTEVLMKICMVLDCQIGDVMEFVPEMNNKKHPIIGTGQKEKTLDLLANHSNGSRVIS